MKERILFMLFAGFFLSVPAFTQSEKGQTGKMSAPEQFDWQGHRGARGLAPENTIPAFLKALEFPSIRTLELDLAVSLDEELVISHEPWLSSGICSNPDGTPVQAGQEGDLVIYKMTYEQVQAFDCGSRGNARFPEQQVQSAHKPTLDVLVKEVEAFCESRQRDLPFFNMEIKSSPDWDGGKTPDPKRFAYLVVEKLKELQLEDRTCVQSFDPRALREVRALNPDLPLALLVENVRSLESNIAELGFTPQIYSPYFQLVRKKTVRKAHQMGMKIIPWTVNETSRMQSLVAMGVDGIITDYPNRIPGK